MDRRHFLVTSLAGALATPLAAEAQQGKIARLGVLLFGTPDTDAFPAIRRGLVALGYIEGQNILFEHRYAEGRLDRLPDLASDLVRSKPDLIIAAGGDVAPFAKRATTTIPIVMITSADPVQGGLVASLARPGGNVTGLTFVSSDLAGKRLQFLKEAAPSLTARRARPARIRVDNRTEFTSKALDPWAYWNRVELDFSRPAKPVDNTFIEAFNGTLRRECLSLHWFFSPGDLQQILEAWRDDYNNGRPHSSLADVPPAEFRAGTDVIEDRSQLEISRV
jgi:Integrase core domain/ABC transporter substrate binding protein